MVRNSTKSARNGQKRHGNGRKSAMSRIRYQEAAGLVVKRGRPPAGPAPSKADLVKLYVREGRAVRDVAAVLGTSKDMVHRKLKEYGIAVRPNIPRSKLRTIPIRDLKAAIRDKGIRGTARDMGVDEGTIRHYLKVQGVPVPGRRRRKSLNPQGESGNSVA